MGGGADREDPAMVSPKTGSEQLKLKTGDKKKTPWSAHLLRDQSLRRENKSDR
jgi:hypothetical protein